jgi:hypothetical protein
LKISVVLISILFSVGGFSSCDNVKIDFKNDFQKSEKAWMNFKNASINSYQYTVVGGSWVGFGWETKLTVKNGVITERYYKLTPPLDSENQVVIEWNEESQNLNTHETSAAASTINIDEIYLKAKQEWLIKRDDSKTYFEVNTDGILIMAGYVPNGCQDDCFVGINIRSIEML